MGTRLAETSNKAIISEQNICPAMARVAGVAPPALFEKGVRSNPVSNKSVQSVDWCCLFFNKTSDIYISLESRERAEAEYAIFFNLNKYMAS